MTHAHTEAPQTVRQPNARRADRDADRERRYQRALAGWIASRMRAGAHRRRAHR